MTLFHHILSSDPIMISCDTDMEFYYIKGEEVFQDEIIMALAETFDNPAERAVIADELSQEHDEMERAEMREREIEIAFIATHGQIQCFD